MPPIPVFIALADPTRCRIIEILRGGAQPVHGLAASFDISRPAISRHLRVLKQAGLISEKKIGRENRYALHAGRLKPARDWLETVLPPVKAVARAAPLVVEAPAPAPTPAVLTPPAALARPRPAKLVSQMGFDF